MFPFLAQFYSKFSVKATKFDVVVVVVVFFLSVFLVFFFSFVFVFPCSLNGKST